MEPFVLKDLTPQTVFYYFERLSRIPRASGKEKAASAYVADFCAEHGLSYRQDDLYNIVVYKPGSPGTEHLSPVILQGHLDMVCEKNAGTSHDFDHQGLVLSQDGTWIRAEGTTLGADNGIAVAYMMAILADRTLPHPPLECVFTTQEEIGLLGAAALDAAWLSGRTMINLDSEEEGVATVSCAGGVRVAMEQTPDWMPCQSGSALEIQVRGLLGGHSGADIHLEHLNANKIMGRALYCLSEKASFSLSAIAGGNKDNAIPRECTATIVFSSSAQAMAAQKEIALMAMTIQNEGKEVEPAFTLFAAAVSLPAQILSEAQTRSLIRLLFLAPNGVQSRNPDTQFILSSLNLGVVRLTEESLKIVLSPRSSLQSLLDECKKQLVLLGELLGFRVTCSAEYPGWQYQPHSPIRQVFLQAYQELFDAELKVEAIHAGLECGIFSSKLPGLDVIAVGPSLYGCHTPDEKLDIASAARTWQLLLRVLERLTQQDF